MRTTKVRAKFLNNLQQSSIFMHLGEKSWSNCGPFCSFEGGGGVLEHPQHPTRYGPGVSRNYATTGIKSFGKSL